MLPLANGRFDDGGMECIRDEADDQIVFSDFEVQSVVVSDVDRDGIGILDTRGERFGGFESPAGCREISRIPWGNSQRETYRRSRRRPIQRASQASAW